LVLVWQAQNAGNESRRAVAVPFAASVPQVCAIASGYLFPTPDGPKYVLGSAVLLGMTIFALVVVGIYQFLCAHENKKRDLREGVPGPNFKPDTINYADDAIGFRYVP
jgi:hypothetical protein